MGRGKKESTWAEASFVWQRSTTWEEWAGGIMDHETNSGPFMRLRFLIVIPERQEPGGDKTTFVLKIIIGIREKERKNWSYHLIIMSDHHLVAGGRTSSLLIKSRHFSHFHQYSREEWWRAEEAVGGHSNGLVVGHQAEWVDILLPISGFRLNEKFQSNTFNRLTLVLRIIKV